MECPDDGGDDDRGMERPPAERETEDRDTREKMGRTEGVETAPPAALRPAVGSFVDQWNSMMSLGWVCHPDVGGTPVFARSSAAGRTPAQIRADNRLVRGRDYFVGIEEVKAYARKEMGWVEDAKSKAPAEAGTTPSAVRPGAAVVPQFRGELAAAMATLAASRGAPARPVANAESARQILQTNRTRETSTQPTHSDGGLTNRTTERREVATVSDGSAAAAAAHQSSTGEPIPCNHQRQHSKGKTLLAIQKANASTVPPNCHQQRNAEQQFPAPSYNVIQRAKDIAMQVHAQGGPDNLLNNYKGDSHSSENLMTEKENPNGRTRQDDSSRGGDRFNPTNSGNDKFNAQEDVAKECCSRQGEQNEATRQLQHNLAYEHRRQLKLAHEQVRNQCRDQANRQVRAPMLHRPSDTNRLATHLDNGAKENNHRRKKSVTPSNSAAPRRSGAEWFEFNIARASSLGQLQSMRHRLKALLGQCEARIETELVKKALDDHLLGDDGPRAISCGDECDVCCPLCLSVENDRRVSCPTCEQDAICKHCTGTLYALAMCFPHIILC